MMKKHLAVTAILEGSVPGTVHADDPARPRAVLARTGRRIYLTGIDPGGTASDALRRHFDESVYPQGRAAGESLVVLYYEPEGWGERIEGTILAGRDPIPALRQYYAFRAPRAPYDWRTLLPQGFEVRAVDERLLADEGLARLDDLKEELCSERPSVQAFLAQSFGFVALRGREITGWCLSEYNSGDRCEVGITTMEPFRRQGLATALASALVGEALARSISEVGWHSYASNVASVATALKAGFEHVADYPAYEVWFDEATNLAAHGSVCLRDGAYDEALAWFEKALSHGEVPAWGYWSAACAAARLGRSGEAFHYLEGAAARGFVRSDLLARSEHLASLRALPAWDVLLARIGASEEPDRSLGP
jgi:GNAT superfamily N-acetyltransferase